MAKSKTTEEKAKFVSDNLHLVPEKSKERFNSWDVDKQYNKMRTYVSKSKKLNITSIVNEITKKNPSPSDVEQIITQLQEWVNSSTTRRINEIKNMQERLAKELKELTGE